ncbi:hypothetical protein ADN00_15540 [Ornatilinea apprima]|uniref:Uncharacterized protein n=2 Tax=Ornatilinea apprima TaxID=1134406 RepID=A0A0P6XRE4_9CHLR|nr:hypothetical protein ADN00_15540 [Ornatilinea apprima]
MLLDLKVVNQILNSEPAGNVSLMAIPGNRPAVIVQTPNGQKIILTPDMARQLAKQLSPMADLAQPNLENGYGD